MPENERIRKDPEHRALVRRIAIIALTSVMVVAFALFNYFLPFETLLPAYQFPTRSKGELRVHFLSVGQGDATIVEFPEGDLLIVDAGDGSFENGNKIYRYVKGLGAQGITLVATHADLDHCGGMKSLMDAFGAEKLYLPAIPSENKFYSEMIEAAKRVGCETETLTRYGVIARPSGAYLVCLSPYSQGEADKNAASTLLYLHYADTNILLGADIDAARERRLVREYELLSTVFDSGEYAVRLDETDILRVSHHGSATSSSEEWLRLLGAEVGIISCGADNYYKHPAAEAVARISREVDTVYRIDELGDIVVSVTQEGYKVFTNFTE
ncbi:MAG: MBL fold metallo-hydrolase [Clostridia bacterium]|nr:MBL fold metallo-hydrolase [Clostridia bacterium]